MRNDRKLRFSDWHPIGIIGAILFISVATLFLLFIWSPAVSVISWRGLVTLWAVRIGVSAFLMLFFYAGLVMLFGDYSVVILPESKLIKHRRRPFPIARRKVIPFNDIQCVAVEPRRLSGPFTSAQGFGVFMVGTDRIFVFDTRNEAEAIEVASSVAEALNVPTHRGAGAA